LASDPWSCDTPLGRVLDAGRWWWSCCHVMGDSGLGGAADVELWRAEAARWRAEAEQLAGCRAEAERLEADTVVLLARVADFGGSGRGAR
jgi:hypothetical protein